MPAFLVKNIFLEQKNMTSRSYDNFKTCFFIIYNSILVWCFVERRQVRMKTYLKFVLIVFVALNLLILFCGWNKSENSGAVIRNVKKCGRFPKEEHITIDNVIWQVMETSNGFVKLLNAYLDTRQNRTVVRVNVNSVTINESMIFCQFWFDENPAPYVVQASEVFSMWCEFLALNIRIDSINSSNSRKKLSDMNR